MRRILAVAGSVLLALALTAPAVVAVDNVTGITVQSATVDKSGLVLVSGTIYCQPGISYVDIIGTVTQAIGHKTTISGGFGGNVNDCAANGPTSFTVAVYANTGIFASGWANVQVAFGLLRCDPLGCPFEWWAGNDFRVKVTKY